MSDNLFKQCQDRLVKEGLLKAFLYGLIFGGAALFVSAFVFWMVEPKLFWVPLIIFAVVTAVAMLVFYRVKCRPTIKRTAARIDALGLEERVLTMKEFEKESSYIVVRQREDAKKAMTTINAKMIKITISLFLIIATPIALFLGAGMATVTALSNSGYIPSGGALIDEVTPEPPEEYVSVSYYIIGGGYFEGGEPEQYIVKGSDADLIMAVPEDGWVFLMWSDGVTDPARQDRDVMEDLAVTAVMMELMDMGGFGEGPGEGEPGDGPPQDGQEGSSDENSDQQGMQGGASGSYEPSNQIIDGTIFYKDSDRYEEGKGEAVDILENGGTLESGEELPDELKEILETYFDILA